MKIAKSWRTKGYFSARFFGVLLCFGALVGFLVPSVMALDSGKVTDVQPGSGTLKAAVENASDGDTLRLRGGSYTGEVANRTVEIDKNLTIEGAGRDSTIVSLPIEITGADKNVTLKSFGNGPQQIEPGFVFIKVNAKANLNIEDVKFDGIMRGSGDSGYLQHDATGLMVETGANGSTINVKNSIFAKPGSHWGILNKASNTKMTLNNTEVAGRVAVEFDNGSENKLQLENGTVVSGPSVNYKDNEAVIIKQQTGLEITLDGSTIRGVLPANKGAIKVISFDAESTGVKIKLNNGSVMSYQTKDGQPDNRVFGFAKATGAEKNHEITIDETSRIYESVLGGKYGYDEIEQKAIDPAHEYESLENAAVIGVTDQNGVRTVKVYNNDSSIEGVEDLEKEGYIFKGWFKKVENGVYSEEFAKLEDGSYPKAKSGENMDLYPKFVKKVKVTIGESEPEVLEEGQTLADIEGIDEKLAALKQANQNHKGYIIHGATGGDISYTAENVEELKKYQITEDVTVEAVHNVTLTVNETPFEIEVGQKVADITNPEDYNTAKLNGKGAERFSRLVYEGGDTTFDEENTPINENTKVVTKHFAEVSLEWAPVTKYYVEEGKNVSEDKDGTLAEALTTKENEAVENKTFKQFEDGEGNKIEGESTVSKDMTVKPTYTVTVSIRGKEYTIDEGKNLNSLTDKADEIKTELKGLVSDAQDLEFHGFVIAQAGGDEKTIDVDAAGAEGKIDEIMGETLKTNTTIFAKSSAKVTIKCPESACEGEEKVFSVKTGTRLTNLAEGETATDYNKAKYQKFYDKTDEWAERFARFVVSGTEETFAEDQEITKSITIMPKYYAFVTIEDDRPDVAGKFKVEEGGNINAMVSMGAQELDVETILTKLQSNIEPTQEELNANPEAETLHFEQLVDLEASQEGTAVKVPEAITKDVRVGALYHYDVVIVQDYDNPVGDLGGVDANRYGFKVYRGRNFTTSRHARDIKTALEALKTSATKDGRRFYRYVDTKMGVTYDENAILEKAFNRHVYISAQVEYKVEIENDPTEYYVVEGQPMSSNATIGATMDLMQSRVTDKVLHAYKLDGDPKGDSLAEGKQAILDTVINKTGHKISGEWYVQVTIGDQVFSIPENGTLAGKLSEEEQQRARAALEKVKHDAEDKSDGLGFDSFSVGNNNAEEVDDVMNYQFGVNTQVVAKQAIKLTIDGVNYGSVETGQTLKDNIKTLQTHKDSCGTSHPGSEFSRFVTTDGTAFAEDTPFSESLELTTKCAYPVTVKADGAEDSSFRVDVGATFNSDERLNERLNELMAERTNKSFSRFVDDDGALVDVSGESKKTSITPVYQVKVTIDGKAYYIDEGKTLNDASDNAALLEQLKSLENAGDKEFTGYLVDNNNLDQENLLKRKFYENTTVGVEYKVKITMDGSDASVLLVPGTLFKDSNELKEMLGSVKVPENKAGVAYFVDGEGNQVGDEHVFEVNTTLTPKYTVRVSFEDGTEAEIVEETTVKESEELMAALQSEEKDFKEFADNEKGIKSLDDPIMENVTLKPLYTVKVTVKDVKDLGLAAYARTEPYKVDEGTTVQQFIDGEYAKDKPEGFKGFKDAEGAAIDPGTELHKHTTLYAMRDVKITFPGDVEETLEAGKTLSDIEGGLDAIKNSDQEGRKFARFVNKATGETVDEKTPIFENMEVVPKFFNKVTIFGQDDEGKAIEGVEPLEMEVEEEQPLSEENKQALSKWVFDNRLALAAVGKANYDVDHYLNEDGDLFDINGNGFKNNDKLTAVFAYRSEAAPVVPVVPVEPEGNVNVGSPDTGEETAREEMAQMENIAAGVATFVIAVVIAFTAYRVQRRANS